MEVFLKTEAKRLNAVIRDIHQCSNHLRMRTNEIHQDLNGINASMRSVMEILSYARPITVPEIGRVKGVSRQHIQLVVNTLLEMNLIKRQDNPDDKRTYLVSLTSVGKDTYDAIQLREMNELQTLCDEFDSEELRVATKMMQKLNKLVTKGFN